MTLSNLFKQKYAILNGNNIYVANPKSKYFTDPLFKIFTSKGEYSDYLDKLSENAPKGVVKFLDMFKPSIMKYVIPVYRQSGDPLYNITDTMVIANIDKGISSSNELLRICGGLIVRAIIDNVKETQLKTYIIPFADIYTRAMLKAFPRPINLDESYPDLMRIILGWLLKTQKILKLNVFITVCSQADVPFVDKQSAESLFTKIEKSKTVFEALEIFSKDFHIDSRLMVTTLIQKLSLDFALGLENLYHALYMSLIAHIFYIPQELYFLIKSKETQMQNIFKSLVSILNKYKR